MSSAGPLDEEVAALIEMLHATEQRLEELTGGEVDTVADRHGKTILLRRAQVQLRDSEAAMQAAILNALPAHIALLDSQGKILSVNEAWRRFAHGNALQDQGYGTGLNYLEICESASGYGSEDGHRIAAGIRRVMAGEIAIFSIEYPCHSPEEERWFLMTAIPLAGSGVGGVVVTHLDVSAQRKAEGNVRLSESRFRQMAESIRDVFFLLDAHSNRALYVSPAYEEISGYSCSTLYSDLEAWVAAIHPEDRDSTYLKFKEGMQSRTFNLAYRLIRPDGTVRWIEANAFPVRDDTGESTRIAGTAKDVTERALASAVLLESQQRLSLATESAHLGIWEFDVTSDRLIWDSQMYVLYGIARQDFSGAYAAWKNGLHPEDRELAEAELAAALEGVRDFNTEFRIVWPNADVRHIEGHGLVQRAADGTAMRIIGVNWDITARKRAEIRIRYLNRMYAVLSGINTMIVRAQDREALFREACRITIEDGGFKLSLIALAERGSNKLVPVASAGSEGGLLAVIKGVMASGPMTPGSMIARAMTGKVAVVSNDSQHDPRLRFGKHYIEAGVRSMAVLPLIVADVAVGVLVLYASELEFFHAEELKLLTELAGDIAFAIDHIEQQDRLEYLAYYDVLTGLANRRLFIERVSQYIRSAAAGGHGVAMFLFDVERFKNINDSFGQPAGDALLRQLAEWLTRLTGDASVLARLGADHFAMVLPEVRKEGDVVRLIEKSMESLLDHPFRVQDAGFRISVKAGIALFPDDGGTADELFMNAEAALKMAKQSGDDYLFYAQKMNESVAGRVTLEYQLRQAIDHEEFVLYYQPKFNLASGLLTGAEALIRWNDPRTGLVAPGRFVAVLEETGLIHEVGRWALRTAIEDGLRWRSSGFAAVRIAVNVSPLQLRNRDFVAEIAGRTAIDTAAAVKLELEITESVIMENVEHSIASLHAIRAMGVSIAIDDFGTGFSSLSALSRLPVDTLKIDRSFVVAMTSGPQGLALVSTIINLAHSLKLTVVAEGVETEEQSRLLRLLDCDEVQGFLYSKPVSRELFEERFLRTLPGTTPATH